MPNANFLSLTFSSSQENDLLARSVKRIKESDVAPPTLSKEESMADAAAAAPSYRDKLLLDRIVETPDVDLSFDAISDYLDE
ncbi:hypothetical protein SLE2022_142020 [Rubroshorea leprosula]